MKAISIIVGLFFAFHAHAAIENAALVDEFVAQMVSKHHFDRLEVKSWLDAVEIKPAILKSMSAPAEGIPWYRYRKIFMTEKRIDGGISFWAQNAEALEAVSAKTGVAAEIIVAIIGVETQYGGNVGSYRVIDALATLGFAYPKRSTFFLSELEQFLVLCRQEHLDPLTPIGSYAGAMGLPQFMPSSYQNFAVDYDQDQQRDIWKNPSDAIASVANYFLKHQWIAGETVFIPVIASNDSYKSVLSKSLEPDLVLADVQRLGIQGAENLPTAAKVKLLAFEQEGAEDLWLGLHNYYVITRYNHSPLYALAVFQLSQAIAQRRAAENILVDKRS